MSALTKTLIVLLTISSIFLCGIVATYVANADNFRQKYNNIRTERDALSKKVDGLNEQLNKKIEQTDRQEDTLRSEIASLTTKLTQLDGNIKEIEREKSLLLQKVSNWTSVVKTFSQTADNRERLLREKLDELKAVKDKQIKERKELRETTESLIEKMAVIDALGRERRQLLEEKAELQRSLDSLQRPFGKAAAAPTPVTPVKQAVRPMVPAGRAIGLKGLITGVDLKNMLAEISIGQADGVKASMIFHATRGDKFICDILILEVDAEKAVGALERIQFQPKAGDKVATNL